jgi:hypothetical protein
MPEINGHAIAIFNIVTKEFKLFKFGTWGGLTYYKETPITMITNVSEALKKYVIDYVERRLRTYHNEYKPTGSYDIIKTIEEYLNSKNFSWWKYNEGLLNIYLEDFYFLYDNYVGDINEPQIEMINQEQSWGKCLLDNLNPNISILPVQ